MPSHSQFLGCVDPRAVEKTLMGVFTQPGPTPAYCIAQSERQLLYVMGIISQIADVPMLQCNSLLATQAEGLIRIAGSSLPRESGRSLPGQ